MPSIHRFIRHLDLFILFHALRILNTCKFHNCFRHGGRFVRDVPPTVRGLHSLLGVNRGIFPCPCVVSVLHQLARLPRFGHVRDTTVAHTSNCGVASGGVCDTRPRSKPTACSGCSNGKPLMIEMFDFSFGGKVPRSPSKGNNNCIFSYEDARGPNECRPCGGLAKLSRPIVQFLRSSNRVLAFLRDICGLTSRRIGHCVRHNFASLVFYFNYANNRRHDICSTRRLTRRVRRGFNMRIRVYRERRRVRRILPTGRWCLTYGFNCLTGD